MIRKEKSSLKKLKPKNVAGNSIIKESTSELSDVVIRRILKYMLDPEQTFLDMNI